ncbi:MAG: YkgJ family cysteine cluster protein [Thermodesulfovibrionales bacterium]|nr:YkgJ family cysteine cluster protein [Thermodesulfovibrionales bacterium]
MLNKKFVEPVERTLNSEFKFRCHKGISCFNQCCKMTDLLLTPYDILRLKNRLGISSAEFLDKYTTLHIDEVSSLPYVMLTMVGEEYKCPFVTSDGCSVYDDRPAICRYYPVGRGVMVTESFRGRENKIFYFFVKEPGCLGYSEPTEWTIETWRIDQGADIYDEMNKEWQDIQLRRDTPGFPKLSEKQQALIYMVSYDIDKFRRFVFESRFLDIFELEDENVDKLKTDEIALMQFGFRYLKHFLMLEKTLQLKEGFRKS